MTNVTHKVFGAAEIHQFHITGGLTFDLSIYFCPMTDTVSAYLYAPVEDGARKVFNFGYWSPASGWPGGQALYDWLKDADVSSYEIISAIRCTIIEAWIDMTGDNRALVLMSHNDQKWRDQRFPAERDSIVRKGLIRLRPQVEQAVYREWTAQYEEDKWNPDPDQSLAHVGPESLN